MLTRTRLLTPLIKGALPILLVAAVTAGYFALEATPEALAADRTEGVQKLRQISDAFVEIAEEASPAVVFIRMERRLDDSAMSSAAPFDFLPGDLFERFFGPFERNRFQPRRAPQQRQRFRPIQQAQGTGFIISPDGYIVTNNHVVQGADRLTVTLGDGREFKGEIVGTDPPTEVAVIKIEATGLPTLPLGDSDNLNVGEWVLAIGNPFGLSHTVTSGIVSAKGRSHVGITDFADFIQTDAAINPGNSGGPLLNLDGEVVGVNTAIFSRSGGNMGIGFAIPINMVEDVKNQLIDGGRVTRGFLGVTIQDVTPELAEWFDIEAGKGALIGKVYEDTPAAEAGLQRDDVVVRLNGEPVESSTSLRNRIAMVRPGDTANLEIIRNGDSIRRKVTIGERPDEQQAAARPSHDSAEELGLRVQNLTPDLAERFGYGAVSGVLVAEVQPGSLASRTGIRPGSLIEEVNRQKVHNTHEFEQALQAGQRNGSVLLLVREGETTRYAVLRSQS